MEKQVRKINSRTLPVYPEYQLIEDSRHYDLLTYLRKEHEGIWYVISVRVHIEYNPNDSSDRKVTLKKETFKQFLYKVYKAILFYKINPSMSLEDGRGFGHIMCDVDEDQRSEYERLILKL